MAVDMLQSARQFIRSHHRNPVFTAAATACEKYLRAYYNEDFYEFARNGESFALRAFARWSSGRPAVIWDVGAHEGHWASAARELVPAARVIGFEILPPVFAKLETLARRVDWLTAENLGLSDRDGEVDVYWNPRHDSTNAISPRLGHKLFSGGVQAVACRVTTGDLYLSRNGGQAPDFLKIDVEGHELAVMRGCSNLFGGHGAPTVIQFEYGATYLPSGSSLGQAYRLLTPHGYRIGRLFPDHVAFADYSYGSDHFRMGNYIAVRDQRLQGVLAGTRRAPRPTRARPTIVTDGRRRLLGGSMQ